jgi:branched-chain amino acid aminotransferase
MSKELLVYINGEFVPESQATISVFDSAFNFGDAVFEGMRVYDGLVFALDEHIKRLYESAKAVAIDIPLTQAEMRVAILDWLRRNNIKDGFHFRPIVTRGDRHPPRTSTKFITSLPNIVFIGGPIDPPEGNGLRLVTASIRRIPPQALDSKIKSGNFLNNILAKIEAFRQGADDALMYDTQGYLAEASAANVFLMRRDVLLTPLPKSCLEGITRGAVMRLAEEQGIPVRERDITPVEVYTADEVFLSGTAAEITPVVEVDARTIGAGEPGPITRDLSARFSEFVRQEGVPIYEE